MTFLVTYKKWKFLIYMCDDLFYLFYTSLSTFNYVWLLFPLFLHDLSLQKRPFITAHLSSSLHMLCIVHHWHCTLKQALVRVLKSIPWQKFASRFLLNLRCLATMLTSTTHPNCQLITHIHVLH